MLFRPPVPASGTGVLDAAYSPRMQCVGTLRWSDVGLGVWSLPARRGQKPAPEAAQPAAGRHAACSGQAVSGGARVNGEGRSVDRTRPMRQGARSMPPEAGPLEIDWSKTVRRCMAGDSGAWAELVRAHHKRVYGLCYRFTGSPTDSEDLTQDVFLKIYSNLGSFDTSRGSLQVWITTMTRNLLVDNFRRTRNQRLTSSLDDGWDQTEELRPVDRLVGREPSPHEMAARKE